MALLGKVRWAIGGLAMQQTHPTLFRQVCILDVKILNVFTDISATPRGQIKHISFFFTVCCSARAVSSYQKHTGSFVI